VLLEQNDPKAIERFADLRQQYPVDPLINYHFERLQAGEISARIKMGAK
jgi:hypothetical protein